MVCTKLSLEDFAGEVNAKFLDYVTIYEKEVVCERQSGVEGDMEFLLTVVQLGTVVRQYLIENIGKD
jgi:hypothetical protein